MSAEASSPAGEEAPSAVQTPACIILGMAGSGKTTLMQRLNAHTHGKGESAYILNLDPAVLKLPYGAHIDIRDTVNYKEVMKQYKLGPNGAIMTALNLFATSFTEVIELVEKRATSMDYVFIDTPGQIEVFTWSASGTIITQMLASTMPTMLVFVVDTPRTASPVTFMSNMLYACSIMYKTKLPFILVFNKTDVLPHDFAIEWMRDFEAFNDALSDTGGATYMTSLMRSMCLVLEEFYKNIRAVGVSAASGDGMDEFFDAVRAATAEYNADYRPQVDRMRADRAAQRAAAGGGAASASAAATAAASAAAMRPPPPPGAADVLAAVAAAKAAAAASGGDESEAAKAAMLDALRQDIDSNRAT